MVSAVDFPYPDYLIKYQTICHAPKCGEAMNSPIISLFVFSSSSPGREKQVSSLILVTLRIVLESEPRGREKMCSFTLLRLS